MERDFRTLFNLTRAKLHDAMLALGFWGMCLMHTCYLVNRAVLTPGKLSNYERFSGIKVDYEFISQLSVLAHQ